MATVVLFRKCDYAVDLVNKWYAAAWDHISLFTDELVTDQRKEFIDHRHDQSVFSVIRKKYGGNIIPDETYFNDFVREGQGFPFWATRLRG